MTRRMTAFILTCLTVLAAAVSLSACAPQPAEPAFLEKIGNAMIFASQGDGQDNNLSVESIVPDADSPEVTAYLDKLRTDKGQDAFEYNFDYVKEVMQMDSATIDDTLYDALIITFTNMPDEDKETFLEIAYIKLESSGKWSLSPVISEMKSRCKGLLDNTQICFYNLSDRESGIDALILGYSLMLQTEKYSSFESSGSYANINVAIERVPEVECDVVLSFGLKDENENVKNLHTVNVLAFRSNIWGVIHTVIEETAPHLTETQAAQLDNDGATSYALRIGASISYTEDGKYEVNLAAADKFMLNMSLRAFAIRDGNVGTVGMGIDAHTIEQAIHDGKIEELYTEMTPEGSEYSDLTVLIDLLLNKGVGFTNDSVEIDYRHALLGAFEYEQTAEYMKRNGLEGVTLTQMDEITDEINDKFPELTYEDMLSLEQKYPECFNYQK